MGLSVSRRAFAYLALAISCAWLSGCGSDSPKAEHVAAAAPALVLHAVIDEPRPGSQIKDKLAVAGWAIATRGTVQEITVFLDGKKVAVAALGGARPDVVQQFAVPGAATSGWYTELNGSRQA